MAENRIIDAVIDTQTIYGYTTDYLNDPYPWNFDQDELTDDQIEASAEKVTAAATDGRLLRMLLDVWDSWVGQQFHDAVYDVCIGFIRDEISRITNAKED